MKKAILLIVAFFLIVGSAFADEETPTPINGGSIKFSLAVNQVIPAFKIEYKGITGSSPAQTGEVAIPLSITEEDIKAVFLVSQYGQISDNKTVAYSIYDGSKSLLITFGKFVLSGDSSVASKKPNVSAAYSTVVSSNDEKLSLSGEPTISDSNSEYNSVTFSPTYNGKLVVDQGIGTVTATWKKDENLPHGTYVAEITLTYSGD